MKSMYLRAVLALLCTVILSACGGGNGSMALSGTINSLAKDGLVLINKPTGEKLPITSGTVTFVFTKLVAVDEQFDVEVDTQPTGAKCTPTANTGKANVYTVYSVVVNCVTNPYTLGGVVKGLSSTGLVLANGPDTVAVLPPATAGADVNFSFTNTVGDGSPYGVTVLAQPAGKTCTVTNPTGTMGSSNYLGLNVVCQ